MIALLWASPIGRMVSIGAIALALGFAGGFLKGYGAANASYWQEQARAAKQAAKDKELLAAADSARATRAEAERNDIETRLEAILNETATSACKLSAADLQRLRKLAAGSR